MCNPFNYFFEYVHFLFHVVECEIHFRRILETTVYVFDTLVNTQEKSYQINMWMNGQIIVFPNLVDVLAKNIFCGADIFICIKTIGPG